MSEPAPYFPFWWEDFWNSCRGSGMKADEIGGYLATLTLQWKLGGPFPDNELRRMHLLTGWDIRTCRTLVDKLLVKAKIDRSAEGMISNERMTLEIHKFCAKKKAAQLREDQRRTRRVADEIDADLRPDLTGDLHGDLKADITVDVEGDRSEKHNNINETPHHRESTDESTNTPVRAHVPSESLNKKEEKIDAHSAEPNAPIDDHDLTPSRAKPRQRPSNDQWLAFWDAYPLRKGKAKAHERFMNLSPEDADIAILGARRYAAECAAKGTDPAYRKWAQGWLGERRFEDYGQEAANDTPTEVIDGKAWGWWRGMEAKLKALPVERWESAIDKARPNGTWPWWKLAAPPGHAECLIPSSIVESRGLDQIYKGKVIHD